MADELKAKPKTLEIPKYFITHMKAVLPGLNDISVVTLPESSSTELDVIKFREDIFKYYLRHPLEPRIGDSYVRGDRITRTGNAQIVEDYPVSGNVKALLSGAILFDYYRIFRDHLADNARYIELDPILTNQFIDLIYDDLEFPLQNSPLIGATFQKVVSAGGPLTIFTITHYIGGESVTISIFIAAAAQIIFGASRGVATALSNGLEYVILSRMGVPTTVIERLMKASDDARSPKNQ